MKFLKWILGVLIIAVGVGYSVYLGVWIMFVGGIIQIVNAIQIQPIASSEIAWGIVKILFCELAGLIAYVVICIGGGFIEYSNQKKRRIK